ncbi:putative glutathione synthetase [Triangularia verruculosa]|uniref:Glutathione synthetase n=1 Tax=Triangularia verruculosa TaxID=2587418 RepID=A0AAN6XGP8_9PEZI|nr:putative glutathione synthetase [Triangularia verruculosa]
MASPTGHSYPPTLDAGLEKDRLSQTIKDWSIANGLAVRPPPALVGQNQDPEGILAINAPVTLFPSPFPKSCFDEAKAIQTSYNELYAQISQDEEFLGRLVQEVAGGDDFIAKLWDVHLKVKKEGYVQNLSLGLFRSDYMVHQDKAHLQIKQVEFNTIASSFGGLSAQTSLLHQHLAQTEYPLLNQPIPTNSLDLPTNNSAQGLAAGLHAAYKAYGKSTLGHPTCVIFLVQDGERNIFDQRHLEYALQESSVPVFRLPFSQVLTHTTLADSPSRQLLYHLPHNPNKTFEVAVAYLRAGYGPGDYPSPEAWEARHRIERSLTIACPTILTQLAGMKKVQQVLATPPTLASGPSTLGKFMPDPAKSSALWKTFTNIYPLDGESAAGKEARRLATDPVECQKYVMKPQREGGGNNFYRGAIPEQLKTVPEEHWNSFILMELITPPPLQNTILRQGKLEQGGVICELGVYGTCLWDQKTGEVKYNEEAGYLLRTKGDQSEEGGVAAGFGCMDSVALV